MTLAEINREHDRIVRLWSREELDSDDLIRIIEKSITLMEEMIKKLNESNQQQ